jgi:hypothetical protein
MNDAVQDGIPEGGVPDEFMPAVHGNLAGHQQHPLFVAVVDDPAGCAAIQR